MKSGNSPWKGPELTLTLNQATLGANIEWAYLDNHADAVDRLLILMYVLNGVCWSRVSFFEDG